MIPWHCLFNLIVYLVGEDEANVVVVDLSVNEEGALEVDAAEAVEADGEAGVGVHRLHDLGALVVDDPVGVDLGVAVGVEDHGLVGPEVGGVDAGVVGAVVQEVWR